VSPTRTRTRSGGIALAAAGVLFVLYPATRPWHDEATRAGAAASMTSTWWVAAHLFAMLGFVLVGLGVLALWQALTGTRSEGTAFAAVLTAWIGVGLTLPYYGAEDFGLQAIAGRAASGNEFDLLATVNDVRYHPAAITSFGIGLVLLAAAGTLAAVAVWRCGLLPPAAGVPAAAGFVLFLPQFFTGPAIRIGHGVLLGAGLLWLGLALTRLANSSTTSRTAPRAIGLRSRQQVPDSGVRLQSR